jgi:hypothetical protein
MKRKFFKIIILTFFNCLSVLIINAQCAAITVNNVTPTDASCPSGGTITVNATGDQLQYAIKSGPAGYLATANNTGIFSGLIAGNYTIQITDFCGISTTINSTVNNTYAPFSVSSSSNTNLCTSFTPGGTINFNVRGGKAPYQYSIVLKDSAPQYSSNVMDTFYSKAVTVFGIYKVYAKDACGEVRTKELNINRIQSKPYLWFTSLENNRPCGEVIDGLSTTSLRVNFLYQDNNAYQITRLFGAKVKVFKPLVVNSITQSSNTCNTAIGAMLDSFVVGTSYTEPSFPSSILFTIPKQDLIIQIETLCGDTTKICYNYNNGFSDLPSATINVTQVSCTTTWDSQNLKVILKNHFGLKAPLSFKITKADNTQINQATSSSFYNLLPSDFPLTYTITDACGTIVNRTATLPTQGSPLVATLDPNWSYQCTNTLNATSANLIITSGDLPGIEEAVIKTIVGGPANVIPKIGNYDDWAPGYLVSNLIGGYSYKVHITNKCGESDSLNFTMPINNLLQPPLMWNLVLTKNQLCGANTGSVTAKSNFSGSQSPTYSLYNMNNPNVAISNNSNGFFDLLPPANYKIKFAVNTSTFSCPGNIIADSAYINIIDNNIGQTITKKTIFACESAGSPTGTGKAIIEVDGSGPYTYEIIKNSLIGTGASEVWIASSTNNPSNSYTWDIPLPGDPITTAYTLRSTDMCGNKITTIAALQPLSPAQLLNDIQPCVGQTNYSFGLRTQPGNGFTYRWVKLPDTITTISTTNSIQFPGSYQASFDGQYKVYVKYGTCIEREYTYTLNNSQCGKTLPILLHEFNGTQFTSNVMLNWKSQHELYLQKYEVERSLDGRNFSKVANIAIKQNTSIMNQYSFKDFKFPSNETAVFYRLKLIELNGNFNYSPILKFSNKTSNHIYLTLAPNPVKVETIVNFKSEINGKATLLIFDQTGNVVDKQLLTVSKGYNAIQVIPQVVAGVYSIQLQIGNAVMKTKFVKL